jgi:hypothetical protein
LRAKNDDVPHECEALHIGIGTHRA